MQIQTDFLTINIGNLITIGVLLVGVTINLTMVRSGLLRLSERMVPVEEELKRLREVVVVSARQEERMTAMDQRMLAQGQRFDQLYTLVMKRIIDNNHTNV